MFATPSIPMGIQSSSSPQPSATAMALCASCDRCRARKTKCDGGRPCSNCASKYMKKHKLTRYVYANIRLYHDVVSVSYRDFLRD